MQLAFRNTQRDYPIQTRLLRDWMQDLLSTEWPEFTGECCFHLVSAKRMAEVNWDYLQHEGPTDVITFDLAEDPERQLFLAEIYICPAVAEKQAEEFGTSWPEEVVRYHIHGLLHLAGYDDQAPEDRRRMKRAEERILKSLGRRVPFDALASR